MNLDYIIDNKEKLESIATEGKKLKQLVEAAALIEAILPTLNREICESYDIFNKYVEEEDFDRATYIISRFEPNLKAAMLKNKLDPYKYYEAFDALTKLFG